MVRTSSVAVGRDSVRVCSRTAVVDCTVGRRVGEDLDIDLEFVLDEVAIGNGIDSGAAAGMDGNAGVCAGTGLEADVDALRRYAPPRPPSQASLKNWREIILLPLLRVEGRVWWPRRNL